MILGISAYFHDSAAALVSDGKLIAFSKEERFTRIKHNSAFPRFAIDFCLKEAGITPDQLEEVVFYEDPSLKFTRILTSLLADFPHSWGTFIKAMKSWLGDKIWIKNEISRELDIHPDKISFVPHHISHISQAFLSSPFEQAAFLTLDGVGEWTTTASGLADRSLGMNITDLQNEIYPHSPGLVYAAFTAFLGFRPNSQECNTMALASFGKPEYREQVRKVVDFVEGKLQVDTDCFNFYAQDKRLFTDKFISLFGPPRNMRSPLPFDIWAEGGKAGKVNGEIQKYANIAASVQLVFEEIMVEMARQVRKRTGSEYLCLAGGVTLNAVAVGRIIRESGFREVYVSPDPGDGGAAMGAAMLVSHRKTPLKPIPWNIQAYPGLESGTGKLAAILPHLGLEDWEEYRIEGLRQPASKDIRTIHADSDTELIDYVCQELLNGKIVGWFQGRAEAGPRALGNRSILIHPARTDTAQRLSRKVKFRAAWRPYAISVTKKDAGRLFDFPEDRVPYPARWMQIVQPVKPEMIPPLQAGVHIDGTTRPQVCFPEDNPLYHALLDRFGKLAGLAALLNTSFNESGYPIVNTPEEALIVFARTEMDILVVNNLILQKEYEIIHA